MMTVVIGGSGSGKSAYAEDLLVNRSIGMKRYYIATMQVFGEEGRRKVARHRALRAGKGFATIEQQTSVEKAMDRIGSDFAEGRQETAVLLECMSNLVANEMFSEKGISGAGGIETDLFVREEDVISKVVNGIRQLNAGVEELVIVTNNVFEDGCTYDDSTKEYIRVLGQINQHLAVMADECVEVVVGIPVTIKKCQKTDK